MDQWAAQPNLDSAISQPIDSWSYRPRTVSYRPTRTVIELRARAVELRGMAPTARTRDTRDALVGDCTAF